MPDDKWTEPPNEFRYVLFERIDEATNVRQSYYVAWLPSLCHMMEAVGRKGESQRISVKQFSDLASAWPSIRAAIRTRLRHGYVIIGEGQ